MIRVNIDLLPHGDDESARRIAEVEIVNVTTDRLRVSQDYAWRVREPKEGVDACGFIVDRRGSGAADLLLSVLAEWRSGRTLPIDNHGNPRLPEWIEQDASAWWAEHDERRA